MSIAVLFIYSLWLGFGACNVGEVDVLICRYGGGCGRRRGWRRRAKYERDDLSDYDCLHGWVVLKESEKVERCA